MGRILHGHGLFSSFPIGNPLNSCHVFRIQQYRCETSAAGCRSRSNSTCLYGLRSTCAPSRWEPPATPPPRPSRPERQASCATCPPHSPEPLSRCLLHKASSGPYERSPVSSSQLL